MCTNYSEGSLQNIWPPVFSHSLEWLWLCLKVQQLECGRMKTNVRDECKHVIMKSSINVIMWRHIFQWPFGIKCSFLSWSWDIPLLCSEELPQCLPLEWKGKFLAIQQQLVVILMFTRDSEVRSCCNGDYWNGRARFWPFGIKPFVDLVIMGYYCFTQWGVVTTMIIGMRGWVSETDETDLR